MKSNDSLTFVESQNLLESQNFVEIQNFVESQNCDMAAAHSWGGDIDLVSGQVAPQSKFNFNFNFEY